ncbi:MAG: DNA recombination protein RmuC [Firmicutes bacterium]|nr:DNA recombination protein RmuC [Bacillota bacterium]
MEYIIIGLLVVVIILLIVILAKNNGSKDMIERMGRLDTSITKEIGEFKLNFSKDLRGDFEVLNSKIEYKLNLISDRVNSQLNENFEKSNKTFMNVLERLNKIDEAQKKIDGLNSEIVSLQSVLTDKKTRGTFGEVNLEYILNNAFGPSSSGVYSIQHKMSNGSIADCILYAPAPLGTIAIDSKFPLEDYQKMVDKNRTREERAIFEKNFVMDVKKHINDISEKYIIPGETSNEAIMFLPAEAIFAEINAYHPELINYAYSKRVWITGPTTLISTLSIISMILKNMERDKYAQIIHEELDKLGVEFGRYKDRWDKLSRSVKSVNQSLDELHTTTEKITKRFQSIKNAEIDKLKHDEALKLEYDAEELE